MPFAILLPQGAEKFPMPKNATYISADKISNKTWLNGLKSLTREAVAHKLFGSMTADKVMRDMFHDLKIGSCKGYQQAMTFDREKMSIEKAFKKNTQHKERPCLLQICHSVKSTLQCAIEDFKEVCKNFKTLRNNEKELKKLPASERHIYATAIAFWKKHHIHHCSDPQFAKEFRKMLWKYKKLLYQQTRTMKHATVDTVEKCQKAKAVLKKINLLKRKILGGKAIRPIKKIKSENQRELKEKLFALSKKYEMTEVNYLPRGHISQVYSPPGEFEYFFDTNVGLIKKPEKTLDNAPYFPAYSIPICEARIYGKKK